MDYQPHPKSPCFQDLTGQRFGIVTVTGYLGKKGIQAYWEYRCDCGKCGRTSSTNMKIKKSCGCLHRKWLSRKQTTHGETVNETRSPEYTTWAAMVVRCTVPKHKAYSRYGGRGIKVCERWLDSPANFIADMGRRPSSKHSIDRIDNDGDYEPGNCRWATWKQQQRNRTGCHWVRWNSEIITLQEACDRVNLRDVVVHARLGRGWTLSDALKRPSAKYPHDHKPTTATIEDIGVYRRPKATARIRQGIQEAKANG